MTAGILQVPYPKNEPILSYAPGSPEREGIKAELKRQKTLEVEVPLIIGGEELYSGDTAALRCPHEHTLKLGKFHKGTETQVWMAAEAAGRVAREWARAPWQDRAAIFLKAADLLCTKYRDLINGATMLNQSKTVYQAEIDAVCELADFWRFNAHFMARIYGEQPLANAPGSWNSAVYRPLEGFVFAVTPFNFTSIAGNLPTSPAMMGNVVLWKPASSAVLPAYYLMRLLKEAGLPDGVINFLPGSGRMIGDPVLDQPDLAGIHFTGSTRTFNSMWKRIGENVSKGAYRTYPRIVGETGGKDFVIAAPDADVETLSTALFRGAFEYQGQKCSAASRAYIPRSLWPKVKERLKAIADEAPMGDVCDFKNFLGAVIDRASFENITGYLDHARGAEDGEIIIGGEADPSQGWFVSPTVIETTSPKFKSMVEEIFGPVLTVFVYEDTQLESTLELLDTTSPYALTGAIFARDRLLIRKMTDALENAAGNFYINDKPTGAVVGQQPFGGARASGTNDKAGSLLNLLRWTSMRVIKENFIPPVDHRYPHMD